MAWILPSVIWPPLASSGLRLRTSWVVLPMVSRAWSLGFFGCVFASRGDHEDRRGEAANSRASGRGRARGVVMGWVLRAGVEQSLVEVSPGWRRRTRRAAPRTNRDRYRSYSILVIQGRSVDARAPGPSPAGPSRSASRGPED